MGRYTGPKHRLARKEGVNLLDKTSQSLMRRLNIPPGIHGKKRKRRLSEFGLQLREKQKAKTVYGLMEKQFKRLVHNVRRQKGDTKELILSALETRLDSLVYRLGFAKKFDFRVGHLRRYSVSSIKKAIEGVGFKIIKTYRTESILRNSLFLFKPLGFFIKFIRGFLVKIFHVFDQLLVLIFGESQIFIVAKK